MVESLNGRSLPIAPRTASPVAGPCSQRNSKTCRSNSPRPLSRPIIPVVTDCHVTYGNANDDGVKNFLIALRGYRPAKFILTLKIPREAPQPSAGRTALCLARDADLHRRRTIQVQASRQPEQAA